MAGCPPAAKTMLDSDFDSIPNGSFPKVSTHPHVRSDRRYWKTTSTVSFDVAGLPDITPEDIQSYTLESGNVLVTILSLGCITHDWRVPLNGQQVPVVLRYPEQADHLRHPDNYMGVIAGRMTNRVGGARISIDGTGYPLSPKNAPNQLHGGPNGLSRRNWQINADR